MKVLFLTEKFTVEPLGMAYLASALKKAGFDVDLIRVDLPGYLDEIKKYRPDVLAYSLTTGKHRKFIDLNKKIKEQVPALSVFGGAHPTYYPSMVYEKGVDVIVRGEADKSFIELLRDIQIKRKCLNIVEFRSLEQNLDRVPLPDREFLYKYPENRSNPIKNVMTSRGCPYNCSYCFNSLYRKFYKGENWVRWRSVDNVIKECVELKKYPLGLIYFQDDCFAFKRDWLEEFVSKYKKEVGVPFHCQVRIEVVDKDRVKLLKEAGCSGVTFAVESGNEKIRKDLLNRNYSNDAVIKGAEILKEVGLKYRVENMCGIPGETVDNMMETFELNKRIKDCYHWMSIFQPYSGVLLGEVAKEQGFWDGSMDGVKETFFEDTLLNFDNKDLVVNFQRVFSVAVKYRLSKEILKYLIRVKRNKVYDWIWLKVKAKGYKELYGV